MAALTICSDFGARVTCKIKYHNARGTENLRDVLWAPQLTRWFQLPP